MTCQAFVAAGKDQGDNHTHKLDILTVLQTCKNVTKSNICCIFSSCYNIPPLELEYVRHGLALSRVAAPGEHLHLVGHARLELADGVATPSPAKTTVTKVGQKWGRANLWEGDLGE